LSAILAQSSSPEDVRGRLVANLPGVGPKQASMFLRNIGFSFDLAVLDVHVVRFLSLVGLTSGPVRLGDLKSYMAAEKIAQKLAKELGQPVGVLDWAIWVTMKALQELRNESRSTGFGWT
jgi:N-glycosylase/DNA lyase